MRLVQSSLHEEVASTLREQIFAGALAPGSFLDEVALCERLDISRTPLREALKVLTSEGLLRQNDSGAVASHSVGHAAAITSGEGRGKRAVEPDCNR